jgi:hypothetical protein
MAEETEEPINKFIEKIKALEEKRNSRIFFFIEGEEDHICYPQRELLFRKKDEFKDIEKLEVLLHSGGGHADCAYHIAKLFRNHCKELNVIVVSEAKSAATLMCLVADEIHMGERAELGPLDVQITDPIEKGLDQFSPLDEFKSMEFLREYALEVLDYYAIALVRRGGMSVKEAYHEAMPAAASTVAPLYQKVEPSKIGSYRRSLAVGEEYAKRLLRVAGNPPSAADKIAEQLVWKYPAHDFVIDRDEAAEIGLPINNLDKSDENEFIEILDALLSLGESIYEFARPNGEKGEEVVEVQDEKPEPTATKKAKA